MIKIIIYWLLPFTFAAPKTASEIRKRILLQIWSAQRIVDGCKKFRNTALWGGKMVAVKRDAEARRDFFKQLYRQTYYLQSEAKVYQFIVYEIVSVGHILDSVQSKGFATDLRRIEIFKNKIEWLRIALGKGYRPR